MEKWKPVFSLNEVSCTTYDTHSPIPYVAFSCEVFTIKKYRSLIIKEFLSKQYFQALLNVEEVVGKEENG